MVKHDCSKTFPPYYRSAIKLKSMFGKSPFNYLPYRICIRHTKGTLLSKFVIEKLDALKKIASLIVFICVIEFKFNY